MTAISRNASSLFARYRVPSTLLASNSLKRYIDTNSCLWHHSFVTFVHFKLCFYSINITLATGRLNKYWQINIWLSQLALYNSYINWCSLVFNLLSATLHSDWWQRYSVLAAGADMEWWWMVKEETDLTSWLKKIYSSILWVNCTF